MVNIQSWGVYAEQVPLHIILNMILHRNVSLIMVCRVGGGN